jgi:hypothetical protein
MSRVLASLGLHRNPYVDRTAEKTSLLDGSFYLHSDLQGFAPSATTYLFFGRRGSGKTTIRLMMHQRHNEYNAEREARGEPELLVVSCTSFVNSQKNTAVWYFPCVYMLPTSLLSCQPRDFIVNPTFLRFLVSISLNRNLSRWIFASPDALAIA